MSEQTPSDGFGPPPGLVVIGGSAGSLVALLEIVGDLPTDLPAAVCIALHLPPRATTSLAEIVRRVRGHDVAMARDGERLRPGAIRIAVPDRHLVVDGRRLGVTFGPREHRVRPAVDPLFRTAARAYRERLISVVLSGALDDGAAGTISVAVAGGMTIAQDPADALFGDMPANAIATGEVRHVLPVREIGSHITRRVWELVRGTDQFATGAEHPPDDHHMRLDERFTFPTETGLLEPADRDRSLDVIDRPVDPPGDPSPYSCPECGGVLWVVPRGVTEFRCRVGHRYTHEALDGEQEAVIEDALWTALRALEEQASLADRVARRASSRAEGTVTDRFVERRDDSLRRAERIRQALRLVAPDGPRSPQLAPDSRPGATEAGDDDGGSPQRSAGRTSPDAVAADDT